MYDLQNLLRCFQGDTVSILAGPKKQSFLVHQEALNLSGSSSLKTLVSGKWGESKSRIIDWGHTDVDTVSRVCTFLYSGDYETPLPILKADLSPFTSENKAEGEGLTNKATPNVEEDARDEPEPEPQVIPEEEMVEEDVAARSDHTKSDSNLQTTILQSFNARPLTPINNIVQNEVTVKPGTFLDIKKYPYSQHRYIDILLVHAKLYAFAKYHSYPLLINLALRPLTETLDNMQCQEEHAACEVAALANFVYESVGNEGANEEPLRKIISHFVAKNFTFLVRNDLEDSLALGGDFTLDVLRKVSRRLRAESELTRALKQQNDDLRQKVQDLSVVEEQPMDSWAFSSNIRRGGGRRR